MARVCAWCNSILDGDQNVGVHEITHGICNKCNDNVIFQLGVSAQQYIDSLEKPVCIVDQEGRVITANNALQDKLKKDLSHLQDEPGGVVFECPYARLAEGCGNTIHCSGCTIRRVVMDTHQSGKSAYRIPAVLRQEESGEILNIPLHISTEKLGDVVYLRIDS